MDAIVELKREFITSNISEEIDIKNYTIDLIEKYSKENNKNIKISIKDKYFAWLNELEALHYELIIVKFVEKNESK